MKILEAAAVVSLALLLAATAIAQDSPTPDGDAADNGPAAAARSTVDNLLAEVLGVLADTDLTSDQRLASIEKIIRDRFDIAVVARLALGKGKSRFSGPQEASYQCEFEPYLSNYIGSRFDRYQQEKVEIFEVTQMKRDVIVSTRILGGIHDRAILDFRMRESGGRWLAVDVEFEGMSVLKSLHAQFTEVLSAGGPDHLVRSLGEKNGSRSDC